MLHTISTELYFALDILNDDYSHFSLTLLHQSPIPSRKMTYEIYMEIAMTKTTLEISQAHPIHVYTAILVAQLKLAQLTIGLQFL